MSLLDRFRQAVNTARNTSQSDTARKTGQSDTARNTGQSDAARMTQQPPLFAPDISSAAEALATSTPHAAQATPPVKTGHGTSDKHLAVSRLAPREKEVFARCLEGAKMKDIAVELNIKTSTVNGYCREVYRKLGVHSKVQLVLAYSEYRNTEV